MVSVNPWVESVSTEGREVDAAENVFVFVTIVVCVISLVSNDVATSVGCVVKEVHGEFAALDVSVVEAASEEYG